MSAGHRSEKARNKKARNKKARNKKAGNEKYNRRGFRYDEEIMGLGMGSVQEA